LLDRGLAWRDRSLRIGLDDTPLGPEVYIAAPFFKDNEWMGLIVVHFDPANVMQYCPDPEELIVLYPGGTLWPGSQGAMADYIAGQDWDSQLSKRVMGYIRIGGGTYHWLARFLGGTHLIYVVEVKNT